MHEQIIFKISELYKQEHLTTEEFTQLIRLIVNAMTPEEEDYWLSLQKING
jgi:hypothetical protein